jgi:hypothetical protein
VRALYGGSEEFPVHVVRDNGLPDLALTVFANELRRILSDGSVRGYLRETLAFVNWCATDPVTQARQWHWQAEPSQVRHAVRQYLTVAAECRIIVRPDTLGLKVSYINAWFVTNALRHVERGACDEAALARRKQESFHRRLRIIHQTMHRRERLAARPTAQPRKMASDSGHPVSVSGDLAYLLGEDDDDS